MAPENKNRLLGRLGGDVARRPVEYRRDAVLTFLKKRVWSGVPKSELGRTLSRAEEDAILGYGPEPPWV